MTARPTTRQALAALIDHTLLKPDAPADAIEGLCRECARYDFASVCVAPSRVALAKASLAELGSAAAVAAVVGFPHGNTLPEIKAAEAGRVAAIGASEIDMVINLGWLLDGQDEAVRDDIRGVVEAAGQGGALTKVILETGYLKLDQIVAASRQVAEAGAAFVKTSTGFGPRGASIQDIELMRAAVGDALGIKAAGGIRTLHDALSMLGAGATRLGCSSSIAIVEALPDA